MGNETDLPLTPCGCVIGLSCSWFSILASRWWHNPHPRQIVCERSRLSSYTLVPYCTCFFLSQVHFLRWNTKWDRWISLTNQPERFAAYMTRATRATRGSKAATKKPQGTLLSSITLQ